jgi:hypothetical protein
MLYSFILQDTLTAGTRLRRSNLPDVVNASLNSCHLLLWGHLLHFFDVSLGQDNVDLLLTLAVERVCTN